LGFKRNASNKLIEAIIQYNFNLLPAIAINIYRNKGDAYLGAAQEVFNHDLSAKVIFPYKKIETRIIPLKLVQTYNLATTNNHVRNVPRAIIGSESLWNI